MKIWSSKTKLFCETSFKNDMWTRHWTSELEYILAIFKWMLQKYCACHEKVEPRHTNSCNCHAKWPLRSNISVTWNLPPFHGFSVGGFKHRIHKARNPCACHAKSIISDPLQIILQRVEIPAPATRKAFWTSKIKVIRAPGVLTVLTSKSLSRAGVVQILRTWTSKSRPNLSVFNDFDFPIALARRHGANFADLNFKKRTDTASF